MFGLIRVICGARCPGNFWGTNVPECACQRPIQAGYRARE
jgi:hypothetical protein